VKEKAGLPNWSVVSAKLNCQLPICRQRQEYWDASFEESTYCRIQAAIAVEKIPKRAGLSLTSLRDSDESIEWG